jgi:hypothetical protein
MIGVDGESANVETALLLVPEHSADEHPALFDDGSAAQPQMLDDRRRDLFQGTGRGSGGPRLHRKGEPHESRDSPGIA